MCFVNYFSNFWNWSSNVIRLKGLKIISSTTKYTNSSWHDVVTEKYKVAASGTADQILLRDNILDDHGFDIL